MGNMNRIGSYEDMDDNSVNQVPLVAINVQTDVEKMKEIEEDKKKRLRNPFNEGYYEDEDFYTKVSETYDNIINQGGKTKWRDCETRHRLEEIKNGYKAQGVDPLITLMTKCYDEYQVLLKEFPDEKLNDVFVEHLSEFAEILLDEDNTNPEYECGFKIDPTKEKYNCNNLKVEDPYNIQEDEKGAGTSILHLAAHRNLSQIATKFLTLYPKTIFWTDFPDSGDRDSKLAVEIALDANQDDICQLLMSRMLNERVRNLFQARDQYSIARYTLAVLVGNGNMKKTVLAVLDSCVNPDLPFLRQYKNKDDDTEEIWTKLSTIPLRYNFYFEALDGNYEGDFIGEDGNSMNPQYFDISSPSALQMITNCVDKNNADKDPIRHMVVRQLVRKKWEDYGQTTVMIQGAFYLLYLIALSIGLFIGGKSSDPTKYNDALSDTRGVFEVISVIFTMFYLFAEVCQLIKEISTKCGGKYGSYLPWPRIFHVTNVLYILALLGIISIVPCQLLGYKIPARSIATVSYLIIFLQISDYFPLSMDYGTYSNTFKEIVKVDIKQFIVIISFVVLAFSGSIYMAMAASNSFDKDFNNFWHILLQEIRAIFEGKEFADSYADYHVLLTLLILVSMFSIIIVMGNILIGQISDRYTAAKDIATIQYDIDKAKLLVNIERSFFPLLRNQRRTHFKKGLYVNNQELVSDLIKDWNTYFAQDDTTQSDVKKLLDKKILKRSPLTT